MIYNIKIARSNTEDFRTTQTAATIPIYMHNKERTDFLLFHLLQGKNWSPYVASLSERRRSRQNHNSDNFPIQILRRAFVVPSSCLRRAFVVPSPCLRHAFAIPSSIDTCCIEDFTNIRQKELGSNKASVVCSIKQHRLTYDLPLYRPQTAHRRGSMRLTLFSLQNRAIKHHYFCNRSEKNVYLCKIFPRAKKVCFYT